MNKTDPDEGTTAGLVTAGTLVSTGIITTQISAAVPVFVSLKWSAVECSPTYTPPVTGLSHSVNVDSSGPEGPECWVAKRPVGAGVAAHTRVYHHHRPPYERPRQAAEGHLSSAGLLRDAAAQVGAPTAVPQPVNLSTDAALVKQPNGAGRGVAGLTLPLLSCLGMHKHAQVRAARKRDGQGQRSQWKVNMIVILAGESSKDGFSHMTAHHSFGGWWNCIARPHFAKSCFHLQLAG